MRNHCCFLLLWVLRWFTSPGSPSAPMNSERNGPCSHEPGSPIRISPDHSLLAAPRGFSQLATSFFAYSRQGIHTHALSSLTIESTLITECFLSALCNLQLPVNIFSCQKSLFLISQKPGVGFRKVFPRNFRLLPSAGVWWAWVELNYRPHPYQGCALAT